MAFYIIIEKVAETDLVANYRFKSDNENIGFFEINKSSGEVLLTQEMLGDEKNHIFNRAAIKVIRDWKKGELPVFIEWAS